VNPALRASAAHVFVESLTDPSLSPEDDHHLRRVMRLRAAERITVSDGAGGWVEAEMGDHRPQLCGEIHQEVPRPPTCVAAAIPKGDRLEWMVQKLTELDVDRIVLLDCERSVVRLTGERAAKQLVRLRRIAREAAMQSRRVWLPELSLATFGDVATGPGVALAEPDGPSLTGSIHTIVIGPEGGFSPAELAAEVPRIGLADTILRIETAAFAAAFVLARQWRAAS
jgi:16S rRNA (uracil1498-N3)-methyltransferase